MSDYSFYAKPEAFYLFLILYILSNKMSYEKQVIEHELVKINNFNQADIEKAFRKLESASMIYCLDYGDQQILWKETSKGKVLLKCLREQEIQNDLDLNIETIMHNEIKMTDGELILYHINEDNSVYFIHLGSSFRSPNINYGEDLNIETIACGAKAFYEQWLNMKSRKK